jgi:hypothetical protein
MLIATFGRRMINISWYRQIKTFYTISINMFFFIIWGIVSSIFLLNKVDYRLYFVSLASAFLLQFLIAKIKGGRLPMLISILSGIFLTFIVSKGIYLLLNGGFIIFILYLTTKMEYEDVSYDVYKARAKNGLSFILVLGLFLPFIDISLSKSILKFYVMFLISNVVVLREARSYYYKVRNVRNLISNTLISVFILLLSIDAVFAKLLDIVGYIMNIVLRIVGEIVGFLAGLMAKPLMYAISKLRILVALGMNNMKPRESVKIPDAMNDQIEFIELESLKWLMNAAKIIVIIIILAIIFIAVIRVIGISQNKNTALEEHREKLQRERRKKESFITRLMKNYIWPSDLREQVLFVYRKFQEKTFDKGIFKKYMTARQLENVTKAYIENGEGLSTLTNVYNEAKFSNHDVTDVKAKNIREEFNKVKKQL